MKNLKYIYALSSLFVSFFAFSYATNFNDTASTSTSDDTSKENSNTAQEITNQDSAIIDDVIKNNIINSYNSALSSTHTLKLNKGNLVYRNNNKPVTLDFDGIFSITNSSLNSYVIDATYSYDTSKETFKVSSGTIDSSTITYNNSVYTFSSSNELSGILSFPCTKDSKYPMINLDFNFSTIFSTFLKISYDDYKVYSSSTGYTFISKNTTIKVDQNYNLLEVNSNFSDEFTFYFNFNKLDSESNSSKAVEDSTDFVTTLKGLFNDSSFDISYAALIKSTTSNNLKYNGFVTYNGSSLSLNVNEFINSNLQNEITSTFRDNNIYFNISNGLEKGNLIDSEETDLVNATSGLMSNNTQFDYSFNAPLNALINTNIFQNILDLNLSSSSIKDLSESGNIKTFKVNSVEFGLSNDSDIRFELELLNNSLKSISIKDFKTTTSNTMDIEFSINEVKSNTVQINSEAYPIYNSMLPYYKKVTFIVNEIKVGGKFNTSVIDNTNQTTLGFSIKHYDFNLGKSINNISLKDLNASLKGISINYGDSKDKNKTLSTATALFLEDTTATANNSFNLEIENLNYKDGKFYLALKNTSDDSLNKYILESSSIKGLIASVNKLTASDSTKSNSTEKGFNAIKKEYTRISNLIKQINTNYIISELKYDIEHNKSFKKLTKYMTITPTNDSIDVKFNLSKIFETNYFEDGEGYGNNAVVGISLSKKGELISLGVDDVSLTDTNNTVTSTSIGLNDFNSSNILDDKTIKEEWDNTEDKVNSKDLNEVVSKIDDTVQVFNSMIQANSVLQNLISIDFAYKNTKLSGRLSTKFHFNQYADVDDKYIEGSIPLSISGTSDTNEISGLNLEFIYSDSNNYDTLNEKGEIIKAKSKFMGIVDNNKDNNYKLTAGTQIALSLNYAKDDNGRSASKLYAYSDHDTVSSMLVSLSGLNENNTLWPYVIIRTIQKYALNIKEIIDPNNSINTIELLKNLGITDVSSVINLLNSLNTKEEKESAYLKAKVNLGALSEQDAFNQFNVNITLNFNVVPEVRNDEGTITQVREISISSINLEGIEDPSLKVNIALENTSIQKDTETLIRLETEETQVLNDSFTPIQQSSNYNYEDSTINYIDTYNVYNLLQLGIYTTDRKYYNIKGTLKFKASADFFGIGLKSKILNNLYFNIKLNLFKDPKPNNFDKLSQAEQDTYTNKHYKIQGYLKVAINNDGNTIEDTFNNKFTEFFIEPGETADAKDGTVYIFKSYGNAGTQYDTKDWYSSDGEFTYDTNNYYYDKQLSSEVYRDAYSISKGNTIMEGVSDNEAENYINSKLNTYSELSYNDFSKTNYRYVTDTSNVILQGLSKGYYNYNNQSERDAAFNEINKYYSNVAEIYDEPIYGKVKAGDKNSKNTYKNNSESAWSERNNIPSDIRDNYTVGYTEKIEFDWGKLKFVTNKYYYVYSMNTFNNPYDYKGTNYKIKVNETFDTVYGKKEVCDLVGNNDVSIDQITKYKYQLQYKYSYNVEMYKMSKEQFLGDMNIQVDGKESGKAKTMLYYLLDYSEIIGDAIIEVSILGKSIKIPIRDILLGSLYKSIDDSTESDKPKLNYLKGWNIFVNNGGVIGEESYYVSDGDFYITPNDMIGKISSGGNSIAFNTGIHLNFKKDLKTSNEELDFDKWDFNLSQTNTDSDSMLITCTASIFNLNIGIESSDFSFITSNDETFINNEMTRYNKFIEVFNSPNDEETNTFSDTYPTKITLKYNYYVILEYYSYVDGSIIFANDYTVNNIKCNDNKYSKTLHDYLFFQGIN